MTQNATPNLGIAVLKVLRSITKALEVLLVFCFATNRQQGFCVRNAILVNGRVKKKTWLGTEIPSECTAMESS